MRETREPLLNALRQYTAAGNEAEIELSILALHKGLQDALSAYLKSQGYGEVDPKTGFPDLVDLVRDHTDLFGDDEKVVRLLVSLNNTRNQIAHPGGDKPPPHQIASNAEKLAKLIHRFWPEWFGEPCPVSVIGPLSNSERQPEQYAVSESLTRSEPVGQPGQEYVSRPTIEAPSVGPTSKEPSRFVQFLKRMWKDEDQPRLRWKLLFKRLIGIFFFLTLAQMCRTGALSTARWPEPIKYIGIALILAAVGSFVWAIVIIWRVLCQFRLKRLLIVLGIGYGVFTAASLLTSDSPLPLHEQAWSTTQQLFVSVGRGIRDLGQSLIETPEEFHFAYTGRRRPVLLPGMDPSDTSYLTPIPANRPAQLGPGMKPTSTPTRGFVPSQGGTLTPVSEMTRVVTATPTSVATATWTPAVTPTKGQPIPLPLQPPDCPYPLARLTVPRVNEVIKDEIQVEGSANIENLDYYKFEFKREDGEVEDEWHWTASFEEPVEEGVLGTWHVSHLPEGMYTFRLTVVNTQGNYPFPPCDVRVIIKH